MKKLLSIVAASLACATAGAQTANFEGFSGALNLNSVTSTSKASFEDGFSVNYGGQSRNGSLQAAYGFAVSPNAVISIGGTYGIGSSTIGSESFEDFNVKLSSKNAYSLYVEPGFVINDKTLIYGKMSYQSAKARVTISGVPDETKSMNGTGFGAGVRTMINKNTFIQVEFKQIGYGSFSFSNEETGVVSVKPKATLGTIGIGMKF